jgi:hypothetical protein
MDPHLKKSRSVSDRGVTFQSTNFEYLPDVCIFLAMLLLVQIVVHSLCDVVRVQFVAIPNNRKVGLIRICNCANLFEWIPLVSASLPNSLVHSKLD